MKRILIVAAAVFLLAGLLPPDGAADEYNVTVGAWLMFVNRADNLWGNGHRAIKSIYSRPEKKAMFVGYPFIDVSYNPEALAKGEHRFSFYLNSSLEPGSLSAGTRFSFGESSLDVYGFYSLIAKNWQNPYVLYRTSTNTMNTGGKITYTNILGSNVYASYRFGLTDLDKDLIGRLMSSLRQDGYTHTFAAGYRFNVTDRFAVFPELLYELGDYDGKANSYDAYGAALTGEYRIEKSKIVGRIHGRKIKFDATHPIYLKTRDEDYYGAALLALYPDPFGLKNVVLSAGISASQTNSNLRFFDNYQTMGYLAVGYRF